MRERKKGEERRKGKGGEEKGGMNGKGGMEGKREEMIEICALAKRLKLDHSLFFSLFSPPPNPASQKLLWLCSGGVGTTLAVSGSAWEGRDDRLE